MSASPRRRTFGGVIPTPTLDPRRRRACATPPSTHRALLADARGAADRAQPPLGRLRQRHRAVDRLPRLQLRSSRRDGDHRRDPAQNGYAHRLVRQEPQHPALGGEHRRPVHQLARRHGLRLFLRLRRRRHEPVAAGNLFRNTTPIHPYRGKPGWNLITAMADDAIGYIRTNDRDRAEPAVLRPLRAGRHACAAPPDPGMDRQDRGHAPVRRRLEEAARADLRQPEEARRHPAEREADALARHAASAGTSSMPRRRSSSSARPNVYAAYLAYTDHEIGRVIAGVERHGQARQHADHLHQRRQRLERRGLARTARRTR